MVHVPLRVSHLFQPDLSSIANLSSDQISLWILPKGLQDIICTKGWIIIALIAGTDLLGMIAPRRFLRVFPLSRLMKMDHMAHLGGYAMGAHCGYALAAK